MSKQTSWDPLAQWYDGWMGQQGSKHHQLLLPKLLPILDLQPGQQVLDLGCGQGVLSDEVIKAKASYTGVDLSSQLLQIAKQRHQSNNINFIQADVTKLGQNAELADHYFDRAVFLLSIADIDDLSAALTSVTRKVKTEGKLVLAMLHPAFRIPRQSGWGFDEQRKLKYRRIDSYLSENAIPLKPYPGQKGVSKSYHRPLQSYLGELNKLGWAVTDWQEVAITSLLPAEASKADRRAASEIPLFLIIGARQISE